MAFLRLLVLLLIVLSGFYVCFYLYLRENRREYLNAHYPAHATGKERTVFVNAALKAYCQRMARRLVVLVYVLPLTLAMAYLYVTNIH